MATEEGIDVKMGGKHQDRAIVTKRMIGCYITDTDPPLQVRLTMDPRTYNTELRFLRVKRKALKGINTKMVNPPKKGDLDVEFSRDIVGTRYSIVESEDVEKCFTSPNGLSCFLKKTAIRSEIVIMNQYVLLGFSLKVQTLKIETP